MPFSSGSPQGSILGPLLFVLYVADKSNYTDCPMYLYADDTKNVTQYYDNLIQQIALFKGWSSNKYTTVRQITKVPVFNGGAIDAFFVPFEIVPSIKALEIKVSKSFELNTHFSFLCFTMNSTRHLKRRTVPVWKARSLNIDLSETDVFPRLFSFSVPVWVIVIGNWVKSLNFQKRNIRRVSGNQKYKPLFCALNSLPICNTIVIRQMVFLRQIFNGSICLDFSKKFYVQSCYLLVRFERCPRFKTKKNYKLSLRKNRFSVWSVKMPTSYWKWEWIYQIFFQLKSLLSLNIFKNKPLFNSENVSSILGLYNLIEVNIIPFVFITICKLHSLEFCITTKKVESFSISRSVLSWKKWQRFWNYTILLYGHWRNELHLMYKIIYTHNIIPK